MGIEKLIELFIQFLERILPFWIVWDYELGVRMGLWVRPTELKPGIHLKIPFFHKVLTCNAKNETFRVLQNTVTTKDGKTVSISAAVGYCVNDAVKFLAENNDAITNIHDITWGVIGEHLTECDWEDIKKKPTRTAIKNKMKDDCKHLGVTIEFVTLGVITQTRAITLFTQIKEPIPTTSS